jgi:hypothetical protein
MTRKHGTDYDASNCHHGQQQKHNIKIIINRHSLNNTTLIRNTTPLRQKPERHLNLLYL